MAKLQGLVCLTLKLDCVVCTVMPTRVTEPGDMGHLPIKASMGPMAAPAQNHSMWGLSHVSSLPVFRTLSPQIIAFLYVPHTSDQISCMTPHSLPYTKALLTLFLMASLLVETTPSPMARPTEHCLTNNPGLCAHQYPFLVFNAGQTSFYPLE